MTDFRYIKNQPNIKKVQTKTLVCTSRLCLHSSGKKHKNVWVMAFFISTKMIILVLLAFCGVANSNAESFSEGCLVSWHHNVRSGSLGVRYDIKRPLCMWVSAGL